MPSTTNDGVRDFDDYKLVVDDGTSSYLRGVEIDFVDRGDGHATFVFNNLPAVGGGCGTCGSSSGGGSCSGLTRRRPLGSVHRPTT
jgi:iron-sulfur cluster insertion protein